MPPKNLFFMRAASPMFKLSHWISFGLYSEDAKSVKELPPPPLTGLTEAQGRNERPASACRAASLPRCERTGPTRKKRIRSSRLCARESDSEWPICVKWVRLHVCIVCGRSISDEAYLDSLLVPLDLFGEVVDWARRVQSATKAAGKKCAAMEGDRLTRINLIASHSQPPSNPLRRTFARQAIRVLEIPRQDLFEFFHRLVVLLDEFGQGADATTDVNCRGRIRNVETEEETVEPGVGLVFLADLSDLHAAWSVAAEAGAGGVQRRHVP